MRSLYSLFRYPGGKGKLIKSIVASFSAYINQNPNTEYQEPFFGGGSTGLNLAAMNHINEVWINDRDYGIASIWNAVIKEPERLCQLIAQFQPTPKAFFDYKDYLQNSPLRLDDYVEVGFKKLAIHQISFSGLGTKAGGPLGGQQQESEYAVDCRWNANGLQQRVNKLHKILSQKVREGYCSSHDFQTIIEDKANGIIYLDPPYFIKGPELYQVYFTQLDHERLCECLKKTTKPWILSYDNCDEIRKLYDWATIKEVDINYSIATSRDKTEVLIVPKHCASLLKYSTDEVLELF